AYPGDWRPHETIAVGRRLPFEERPIDEIKDIKRTIRVARGMAFDDAKLARQPARAAAVAGAATYTVTRGIPSSLVARRVGDLSVIATADRSSTRRWQREQASLLLARIRLEKPSSQS
ncbi:MAG: hypothetical protein GYB68_10405, partial [Chloroflexi bacterium]|nr:hypothetical protein [Chloroflexota bacterium]